MKDVRIEFVEEAEMAKRYRERAKAEDMSIAAWMRRALRRELFSAPSLPSSEQCAHMSEKQSA